MDIIWIYLIIFLALVWSIYDIEKWIPMFETTTSDMNDSLKEISDNEVFINRTTSIIQENDLMSFSVYYQPFDHEQVEQFKKIEHVKECFSYMKLDPLAVTAIDEKGNVINPSEQTYINDVSSNNMKINSEPAFGEHITVVSDTSERMDHKSYLLDEQVEQGVYISDRLAKALNIQKLNQTDITLMVPIYMGYHLDQGYAFGEDGTPLTEVVDTYGSYSLLGKNHLNSTRNCAVFFRFIISYIWVLW